MTAGPLTTTTGGSVHFRWRRLVSLVWLAVLAAGCTAPGTKLVESPLSIDEQQRAVLEIVPKGTSRDDAERRMKSAGIEFTRGGSGSIYYLALWNRTDGERWHISVALLFDSMGKLYGTRSADSSTTVQADDAGGQSPRTSAENPGTSNPPRETLASESDAGAPADDQERVPFPGRGNKAPLYRY